MPSEAAQTEPLRNWAGNYRYSTNRVTAATSLAQIQEFVRKHQRFKVLGTRHCFNGIADSADALLSLREMKQVVQLDRAARRVTVESGMSYGQLCPYLDEQGYALHNLASLPHISVAGACATATHGSGERNGNLATAVVGNRARHRRRRRPPTLARPRRRHFRRRRRRPRRARRHHEGHARRLSLRSRCRRRSTRTSR